MTAHPRHDARRRSRRPPVFNHRWRADLSSLRTPLTQRHSALSKIASTSDQCQRPPVDRELFELVSKEELMSRVWPKIFFRPANLTVHIARLRHALGQALLHQYSRSRLRLWLPQSPLKRTIRPPILVRRAPRDPGACGRHCIGAKSGVRSSKR